MPLPPSYRVPQRELQFVLHEWLHVEPGLRALVWPGPPARQDIDELVAGLAVFVEDVLAPLNAVGDAHGCTWHHGAVRTPPGFRDAYATFRRNGWTSLGAAAEHGGRGWPTVLTSLVTELAGSANHSWLMYHSISRGSYACIRANGSPAQQDLYLPHLASGAWMGSMCITEPQAGTDVGLIRTQAIPQAGGHFLLTGHKCMATVAEHDFVDNIVHLVLARIEGHPPGSRGLSLFIVPRLRHDGTRNAVACEGLDDKMGIRGTPTCRLRFDGAWGELLGEPGKGLAAMFVMMNIARLGTGMQGMNQAEAAFQMADHHARTRLQGRAPGDAFAAPGPQPLIMHADVRRMLRTQKAWTEAARAMAYWLAWQVDQAAAHPDALERARSEAVVSLLTPVFKAFATDNGYACTTLAQQVMGGWGYLGTSGVHQYLRDVRVGQIYEGANGIQGQDLLGRKVLGDRGGSLADFRRLVWATVAEHIGHPDLRAWAQALHALDQRLAALTDALLRRAEVGEPDLVGACGHSFLRVVGLLAWGWIWLQLAALARKQLDASSASEFYTDKLATAGFYFAHLMPEADYQIRVAEAGSDVLGRPSTAIV